MEQMLQEITDKNWLIAVIFIVISIISALVKVFTGILHTHDEVYLKRNFKRLQSLKDTVAAESDVGGFIEMRMAEEAFALASDIRASSENAKMLISVYQLGFLSKVQLKRIANNLKPVNDKINIELGWFEKSEIFYSFWASIVLFFISFSGLLLLINNPSFVTSAFAIAVLAAGFITVKFVGSAYQKYKTLYFTKLKLEQLGKLANPELNIKIGSVYTPDYETSSKVASYGK